MRQDTGVGSAYIEVNAIPQTLCCEKVILGGPPQVAGFCVLNSVSNFLYSLAGVRDLFVYTIPQSQQKKKESSRGLCISFSP